MIYEYEIAYVGGLFVVFAMGRPQISFPTFEEARSLLRDIAALPFQAASYWPDAKGDTDLIMIMQDEAASQPFAQVGNVQILIELDYQALRLEAAQPLHRQRIVQYSAAIIRG